MCRIRHGRIPTAGPQARSPALSCAILLGSRFSLHLRAVPAAVQGAPSWKSSPGPLLRVVPLLETYFPERYEFLGETLGMGVNFQILNICIRMPTLPAH